MEQKTEKSEYIDQGIPLYNVASMDQRTNKEDDRMLDAAITSTYPQGNKRKCVQIFDSLTGDTHSKDPLRGNSDKGDALWIDLQGKCIGSKSCCPASMASAPALS